MKKLLGVSAGLLVMALGIYTALSNYKKQGHIVSWGGTVGIILLLFGIMMAIKILMNKVRRPGS